MGRPQLGWRQGAIALGAVLLSLSDVSPISAQPRAQAPASRWGADYFPNVALQDQNGRIVHFYDDVIRGKVVGINFVYTECTDICPLDIASMRRVQAILGNRVGRDVFLYSISINPERDTPAALRRVMRTYDVRPGWTFLTGARADIALLQRHFGMTVVGAENLRAHDTDIVLGNETTGEWLRRSSFESPQNIADILGSTLHNYAVVVPGSGPRQSYAAAGEIRETRGAYLYRTRCQACHTMGMGDRLGPDLRGVASARDPAWLARWIREPNRMIAERDPIAMALLPRFNNLPMPNLGLGEVEVTAIVDYMRTEDRTARPRQAAARPQQRH